MQAVQPEMEACTRTRTNQENAAHEEQASIPSLLSEDSGSGSASEAR